MALPRLLDELRTYLDDALAPAPALIGGAHPAASDELPAVSLSLGAVTERLRGLGRLPAPTERGALRVATALDLANPVAAFPGEAVRLLSDDRRTVKLAHGPLVRADGSPDGPFGVDDLRAALGGTVFAPTDGAPGPGLVRVVPATGELVFASPLPATGTLALEYFVGEWEVQTARYQGTLTVEAFAGDAAGVDALSRQLESALRERPRGRVPGLAQLEPMAFGPVLVGDEAHANSRSRTLGYRFDYELVEPRIPAGGGLIARVAVDSTFGPEGFDVTRERS